MFLWLRTHFVFSNGRFYCYLNLWVMALYDFMKMVMAPSHLVLCLEIHLENSAQSHKKLNSAFSQLSIANLHLKTSSLTRAPFSSIMICICNFIFLNPLKYHWWWHKKKAGVNSLPLKWAERGALPSKGGWRTTEGAGECKREADALDCTTVSLSHSDWPWGWSAPLYFITVGYRSPCRLNDSWRLIS